MGVSNPVMSIDTVPASEGWGFLGRILVGDVELYRTIRAYTTPSEALQAMSETLAGVLGPGWPVKSGIRSAGSTMPT